MIQRLNDHLEDLCAGADLPTDEDQSQWQDQTRALDVAAKDGDALANALEAAVASYVTRFGKSLQPPPPPPPPPPPASPWARFAGAAATASAAQVAAAEEAATAAAKIAEERKAESDRAAAAAAAAAAATRDRG